MSPNGRVVRSHLERVPRRGVRVGFGGIGLSVSATTGHVEHRARGHDGLDAVLVVALAILGAGAVVLVVAPQLPERVVAPALDLALDSIALVVTSTVAMLAWIRYRERNQAIALYQAAAFFVLAVTYLRAVIDTVGVDPTAPLSSAEPGQEQLVVFTAGRLVAGLLLVLGGWSALRDGTRWARLVIGVAIAAVVAIAVLAHPAALLVPALLITPPPPAPPVLTTFGAGLHLSGAGLFLAAVLLTRRLWQRDRSIAEAFVSVGLLFAAFALIVGAITPGTHPGPVTLADVLWFAFDVALLLAIEAEARAILATLRRANQSLEELREAEVARAALEERARLSRELHDGLTQDLWLAKLKIGRLTSVVGGDPEVGALIDEATSAIDRGLAEAHQAVMAMRIAAATDGSFSQLLVRYAEDVEDRFGLRVQVSAEPALPALGTRTQAELLRIAQEALTNVHRHAQARTVHVGVRHEGDDVVLSVTDDGVGFEVHDPRPTDFGLLAMRERAAMIGGTLTISSAAGRGTRVEVRAPIAHGARSAADADADAPEEAVR